MCFLNDDYDWYAEEQYLFEAYNYKHGPKCDECFQRIPIGAKIFSIYQQEHGECRCDHCEEVNYSDEEIEFDRDQCDGDYGETYSADWCERCECLRKAIYAVEAEAGCDEYERLPDVCRLIEELCEVDDEERQKYFAKFREMFPWFELPKQLVREDD